MDNHAPAVTRAIRILELLRTTSDPMRLSEVSSKLELVPSSCLHILRALVEERFVAFDHKTKRYKLGLGLLPYSADILRHRGFRQVVQPALDSIGKKYRVTTFAIERESPQTLVVVAVSDNFRTFDLQVVVGTTFHALASASGRCVAAQMALPAKRRRQVFRELKWQRAPSYEEWVAQIEAVHRDGYGVDIGNFFRGATIVSVPFGPIESASRFLAAVGLTEQLSKKTLTDLADALKLEAQALAFL